MVLCTLADAVWTAVIFENWRHAWVIPVGLLIEWPAVLKMTGFKPVKGFIVTLAVNAVSMLLGAMPIFFLQSFGIVVVYLGSVLISTLIEGFTLNLIKRHSFTARTAPLFLFVNALSVGLAMLTVLKFL